MDTAIYNFLWLILCIISCSIYMTIDIRKYGMYIIATFIVLGLFFTSFSEYGVERDKKIGNRKDNNYVETK